MIKPDIHVESGSHTETTYPSFSGRVVCLPYYPAQSSTKIKEDIKNGK